MASSRLEKILTTLLNPKLAIPLLFVLSLLCAPFLFRMSRLKGLPDIGDPFDVAEFCEIDIPDEENAYVEYRQAAAILTEMPEIEEEAFDAFDPFYEALEQGWETAPVEVKTWVEENRAALSIWQAGTEKPDALYHNPAYSDISTELDAPLQLRGFSHLAILESSRLQLEGKLPESWQFYRAAFRSSRHVGRYGSYIERLVGISNHALMTEAINRWASDPRVERQLLLQALAEIKADNQLSESISTILKVEYISSRNSLDQLLSEEESRVVLFIRGEPELSRRILQHKFAAMLSARGESRRKSTIPEYLQRNDLEPYAKHSPMAHFCLSSIGSELEEMLIKEQARQAALEMSLAAQIYFREHGRFPAQVEELLQNGLESIPIDPCSPTGQPMRYRLDDQTGNVTVWSLGEDQVDDGGDIEPGDYNMKLDWGYIIQAPGKPDSP